MTDTPTTVELALWLRRHPQLVFARITRHHTSPAIIAGYNNTIHRKALNLPTTFCNLPITYVPAAPITDLRLRVPAHFKDTPYTQCQNEPVNLGTQIQPRARKWVATAGAPVAYHSQNGLNLYGFLTNWHVLPGGDLDPGWPVHQPNDFRPTFAHLHDWKAVDPRDINFIDAAFADTMVDGFHTTSDAIIGLGVLNPAPIDAHPDLVVRKIGRTTGQTSGACTQTGVAVRVDYGDFTAVFADQDIFETATPPFASPGDSGSLIYCMNQERPCALLFAGGGGITVGNPIRHVLEYLPLSFEFP